MLFTRVRRNLGEFAEIVPLPPQPFSVEIAAAFIWASLLHALTAGLVYVASRCNLVPAPDLRAVLMLLIGRFGHNDKKFQVAIDSIALYPYWVLGYFVATCLVAVAGAWLLSRPAEWLYRKLPWAGREPRPLERFCRKLLWMDGRDLAVTEWRRFLNLGEDKGAFVTAVVDMGGVAYLFLAVLKKPHFNPHTAELEGIELEMVSKRRLDSQAVHGNLTELIDLESEDFEDVFGDQFMLRLSEVKTINIIYANQRETSPAPK